MHVKGASTIYLSSMPVPSALVGAPIFFKASRISCQFPPCRYIIMIVPTPHCSPCSAGFGAILSRAWLNICSDPEAASKSLQCSLQPPFETRAFTTSLADVSCSGFIESAFSTYHTLAAIRERAASVFPEVLVFGAGLQTPSPGLLS